MADRNWTEDLLTPGMRATLDGAEIAVTDLNDLWLIAGDIDAFAAAHPARELGFGGRLSAGDDLLVRLGKDRSLWRSGTDGQLASGWQQGGWAALPVSDGWTAFTLMGAGADTHVRRFLALDLLDGSPSAVAAFGDHGAVILRDEGGWQIWCNAPDAWSLWQSIKPGGKSAS
ncbi:MAG: hypothetical protein KDE08_12210 [Rhodobacteraceae bacterium]|nr:hypothetical protein [Paracoccaceae bacterium]